MAALEVTHHVVDLECGHRSSAAHGGVTNREADDLENEGSADEDDSCYSNEFYSTADGDGSTYDDYSFACGSEILIGEDLDSSRRNSSHSDLSVAAADLKLQVKHNDDDVERDCRICQLSLMSSSPGCGLAIELGCSCKDDLAAAHKHCAETWFKIKGNKTCEICNSIARNVVGPNDIEANNQQLHDSNDIADNNNTSSAATTHNAETRSCLNGHRFLNFLLACMVFAFVISWLFHFNIPS